MKRVLSVALLLLACTTPRTQLVPVVDSDLAPAQIQCVLAEASRVVPGGGFMPIDSPHLFYVHRTGLPAVELPFSFGLLPPGDDASARIELHVAALSTCDETMPAARTVTRTVRAGFVRGQRLVLPIFLSARCTGVTCDATSTCEDGACVPIPEVDPATLTPIAHDGDELSDAGAVLRDAGGTDVGAGTDSAIVLPDAGSTSCAYTTSNNFTGGSSMAAAEVSIAASGTRTFFGLVSGSGATAQVRFTDGGGGSTALGGFFGVNGGPIDCGITSTGSLMGSLTVAGARRLAFTSMTVMPGRSSGGPEHVVDDGSTFHVLLGGATLSVLTFGSNGAAMGTSDIGAFSAGTGMLRRHSRGALVSYRSGGACTVAVWDRATGVASSLSIPGCGMADAGELGDGRIAVAWQDATTFTLGTAIADAALTSLGASTALDSTQTALASFAVTPSAAGGAYRVTWADLTPPEVIRSVRIGATPATECIAVAGDTIAGYRMMRADHAGTNTVVVWGSGNGSAWVQLPD